MRLEYTSDVRIRGRSFSNWWLLAIIPLLAVGLLLLPFLLFAGNGLAGVILGPPAIWNRPWQSPPRQDLVGRYTESERRWDKTIQHTKAQLELRADGTMIVNDLPSDFGEKTCILTGTGRWDGPGYRAEGQPRFCCGSGVIRRLRARRIFWFRVGRSRKTLFSVLGSRRSRLRDGCVAHQE